MAILIHLKACQNFQKHLEAKSGHLLLLLFSPSRVNKELQNVKREKRKHEQKLKSMEEKQNIYAKAQVSLYTYVIFHLIIRIRIYPERLKGGGIICAYIGAQPEFDMVTESRYIFEDKKGMLSNFWMCKLKQYTILRNLHFYCSQSNIICQTVPNNRFFK